MLLHFVVQNWYLFAALAVVILLLIGGPATQYLSGAKSVNISDAVLLINRKSAVVVDVCEPQEFKAGHIPAAVNIPLGALSGRARDLEKYKNRPLVVSCRSGNRSARAASILRKMGFPDVYSLSGGLLAWERENLPVEK